MNNTDAFMDRFAIVKKWFESEETEISDLSLGRMASRLGEYEKSVRAAAFQEVKTRAEGMKTVLYTFAGERGPAPREYSSALSDLVAWIDKQTKK